MEGRVTWETEARDPSLARELEEGFLGAWHVS